MARAQYDRSRHFKTAKELDNLKPLPGQRRELGDLGCPGLRVRVEPSGRKTFVWSTHFGGRLKRITLGQYGKGSGQLSLTKARQRLEELKDDAAEARLSGENIFDRDVKTVDDLIERFHAAVLVRRRKRPGEALEDLQRHVAPWLGKKALEAVRPRDVAAMIENVVRGTKVKRPPLPNGNAPRESKPAPVRAKKIFGLTRQMFSYAVGAGLLKQDPTAGLDASALGVEPHQERDRVLSAEDVRRFYQALDQAPKLAEVTRLAFKVLLLTGLRSSELRTMKWQDVDFSAKTITVRAENLKLSKVRAKNASAFVQPIAPQTVLILRRLRKLAGDSAWVLASPSKTDPRKASQPIDDKALGHALRRLLAAKDSDGEPMLAVDYFTVHDLRRTARTVLAQEGIDPYVCEKYLGHTVGMVERTYNRDPMIEKRREAAKVLARWVDDAVTGQAVVGER